MTILIDVLVVLGVLVVGALLLVLVSPFILAWIWDGE